MLRPSGFGFNKQTAANNFFQSEAGLENSSIQNEAIKEFDNAVSILRSNEIDVLVLEDESISTTPDAIFLNNWFTCRAGFLELYPMFAKNRRLERNDRIIARIKDHTQAREFKDWSEHEKENKFLEGTGSMVFDHVNKTVYACISARTDQTLLEEYCSYHKLKLISFHAVDESSNPVYHTNVVLSIGNNFAVLCEEAIKSSDERNSIIEELQRTSHQVISISLQQVRQYCGNILELKSGKGRRLIVMSRSAYDSFESSEKEALSQYGELIHIPVPVIEKIGGGSIRCMIAELFC